MIINIKVVPGAKKDLMKEENDMLKIYIQAPAVDGKANRYLIDFLAKQYRVRKNQITILKGLKSRHKVISIDDV